MDLQISGRNLEINDRTREHIESKLDQIDRHLPGISGASVELGYEATRSNADRIVAQVTLNVGGTLLRAQRRAANPIAAVNSVAQALDQQIKRYKSHAYRSKRSRLGARAANEETGASDILMSAQRTKDCPAAQTRRIAVSRTGKWSGLRSLRWSR